MNSMTVLGVSAHFHDSAACLIRDGVIVAAAQEEWFTRKKHDQSFPVNAIRWCLESQAMALADVDWFAFFELPSLRRRRNIEAGLACDERAAGRWRADVGGMFSRGRHGARVLAVEHHASHAASAFFPSPFEEAAVVTIDAVGEYTTTSISVGAGNQLDPVLRQDFPHSLGLLYSAFTDYCGFKVNSGEYKLMGLAPYGKPRYAGLIREHLVKIGEDGAFRLNLDYFAFLRPGAKRIVSPSFDALLGRPRRDPESEIDEFYADMAASIQQVFEEAVVKIARYAGAVTGMRKLCLAGGGALNCVANSKVLDDGAFDDIWVQPAAGDAGGSLGAACFTWFRHLRNQRTPPAGDRMRGALLGPAFDDLTVRRYLESVGARYRVMAEDDLIRTAVDYLVAGKTIAWFQGAQEFGPRALGNRSILADPRRAGVQRHLNLAVKNRESFRPFAPAVTAESASKYFGAVRESPYMLFTAPVRADGPIGTAEPAWVPPATRAAQVRGILPAVTHVDYSARLQTVGRDGNRLFWTLLHRFGIATGVPVLVNTSFNVRGEPIVCTPADALRTFLSTKIDYLFIGSHVLDRHDLVSVAAAGVHVPEMD
jgi:carbamoyltransferase